MARRGAGDVPRYRLDALGAAAVAVEGAGLVEPHGSFSLTVELGPGELRPGLINAHDHLHRNHYPRLGSPPYPDSYAWGRDIHERHADVIARGRAVPRRDALLFGALKNLLAGATTVVHHDAWETAFDERFPVRVPRVRTAHSPGLEPDLRAAARSGDPRRPLCIHLAEGTTPEAAGEVRALDALGLLDERLLAVHGVGVDADGIRRMRASGAALVWCPTSNAFLVGRTAPRALLESGVEVLLGSDSLLTGEGTLLDELRAARRHGVLEDDRLLEAVGAVAARRLGLPEPTLSPGGPADLVHLRRSPLEAGAADVRLVVVAGIPRFGEARFAELFDATGVAVERLQVAGEERLVAAPLASVARRIVADWPESGRILAPGEPASRSGHRG